MNEYTYEIWCKKLHAWKSEYEFESVEACIADNAIEALEIAKKKASHGIMPGSFAYQARNLKKL